MTTLLRRLRGILGLAAIGGVFGGLLGLGFTVIRNLTTWGSLGGFSLASGVTGWALFGAFSGGGFAALVSLVGFERLENLTAFRGALLGGVVGALFPIILIGVIGLGGPVPLASYVGAALAMGLVGASIGGTFAAVAHGGEPQLLEPGPEAPPLSEGSAPER